jgi:hypothetical protein
MIVDIRDFHCICGKITIKTLNLLSDQVNNHNMMNLRKCNKPDKPEMVPEHVSPATDEEVAVTQYPAAPVRDHPIEK